MEFRRLITNLSIVQSNLEDAKADYLDSFLPFLITLINKKKYASFGNRDVETIAKDFENEFGIAIKHYPTVTLIKRCKKLGVIKEEGNSFYVDYNLANKYDITSKVSEHERNTEMLFTKMQSWFKDKYNHVCEVDQIDAALAVYLETFDRDLIRAGLYNIKLPEIQEKKKLVYLIDNFVIDSFNNDVDMFQRILNFTIGHMLTTLLFVKDSGEKVNAYQSKLRKVKIYLDTGFLLSVLGMDGKYRKEVCLDLIQISEALVRICYCDITSYELDGV